MKKQLILFMVAALCLGACKKRDNTKEQPVAFSDEARVSVAVGPENSRNSYDSIGYWHNRILTYIQSCKVDCGVADPQFSVSCIVNFYRLEFGIAVPESSFATIVWTVSDRKNKFNNVIAACAYPQPVQRTLHMFISTLEKLADTSDNYSAVKSFITNFEEAILHDKEFSEADRAVLLKTSSVARYSIYYWINLPVKAAAASKLKNIIKWIAAVTSDIGGAAVSLDAGYAAGCSSYAYDLITYSMP